MYPDDSIQAIFNPDEWWVKDTDHKLKRGSLIFAFVPHVDQVPLTIEPIGRRNPEQHEEAQVRIRSLSIQKARRTSNLPVAAMPMHAGEVQAVYRAKKRPCLVIGCGGVPVNTDLVKRSPKRSTAKTTLVAPYYGVDRTGGRRAGYNPDFVERVRHGTYPQFFWDRLPISGSPEGSILRLDHLQPVGTHSLSYEFSGHTIGAEAMEVIDEILRWLIWGGVDKDGLFAQWREELMAELGD